MMKFTKSQIVKVNHIETFKFDEMVDVSELSEMNNDIIRLDPVHVSGHCTVHGNEFTFQFNIQGEMILPCARTLIEVPYPFSIQAIEVFTTNEAEETEEIHLIDGEVLDLMPYIKENILLEIPFRVFSDDEEAMSKVKMSGPGWEFISEESTETKQDPRLKKLESFFQDRKKENE